MNHCVNPPSPPVQKALDSVDTGSKILLGFIFGDLQTGHGNIETLLEIMYLKIRGMLVLLRAFEKWSCHIINYSLTQAQAVRKDRTPHFLVQKELPSL